MFPAEQYVERLLTGREFKIVHIFSRLFPREDSKHVDLHGMESARSQEWTAARPELPSPWATVVRFGWKLRMWIRNAEDWTLASADREENAVTSLNILLERTHADGLILCFNLNASNQLKMSSFRIFLVLFVVAFFNTSCCQREEIDKAIKTVKNILDSQEDILSLLENHREDLGLLYRSTPYHRDVCNACMYLEQGNREKVIYHLRQVVNQTEVEPSKKRSTKWAKCMWIPLVLYVDSASFDFIALADCLFGVGKGSSSSTFVNNNNRTIFLMKLVPCFDEISEIQHGPAADSWTFSVFFIEKSWE